MNVPAFLKYTGTKRTMSKDIIKLAPTNIHTYYEPFCGSCSVAYQFIIQNKAIEYKCSDKLEVLINLWKLLQNNPKYLYDTYNSLWNKLYNDPNTYYAVRDEFNLTKSPELFYFLTRTCINRINTIQ